MDCGHWAVLRACELFGFSVAPQEVIQAMPATEKGHSMKQIANALRGFGLTTSAQRESLSAFLGMSGVRIVHLKSPDHFVVVTHCTPDTLTYFDDFGRHQVIETASLRDRWSGYVLNVAKPVLEETGPSADNGPRLCFETLFLDKGDIPLTSEGQMVQYDFVFVNRGTNDLQIRAVHKNCSCISADFPKNAIPPGKGGRIHLEYVVDARRRTFINEVLVESNDPRNPSMMLRAAGHVDCLLSVIPSESTLGDVEIGSEKEVYLVVRNYSANRLRIDSLKCEIPGMSTTVQLLTDPKVCSKIWPESYGQIRLSESLQVVSIKAKAVGPVIGPVIGHLTLTSNISKFEIVRVPIRAHILRQAVSVPSLLGVTQAIGAAPWKKTIRVISCGKHELTIVQTNAREGGLQATVSRRSAYEHEIVVAPHHPPSIPGSSQFTFIVTCKSDSGVFTIEVPICVMVTGGEGVK